MSRKLKVPMAHEHTIAHIFLYSCKKNNWMHRSSSRGSELRLSAKYLSILASVRDTKYFSDSKYRSSVSAVYVHRLTTHKVPEF